MVRQATFEYANRLKERIEKIKPQPITRQTCSFSVNSQCHPIYCCVAYRNVVRSSLQTPCDRSYKVIQGGEKNFNIKINNRKVTVSIDRLKPLFLVDDNIEQQSVEYHDIIIPLRHQIERSDTRTNTRNKYVTRAGRRVPFSDTLQAGFE